MHQSDIERLIELMQTQAETNAAIFDILMFVCRQIRIDLPDVASQIEAQLKIIVDSPSVKKSDAFVGLSQKAILALSSDQLWFQSLEFPSSQDPDKKPPFLTVLEGGLKDPE